MEVLLWTALALPAFAGLAARVAGRAAPAVAVTGAAFGLVVSAVLLVIAAGGDRVRSTFAWLPGGGLDAGLRLDGLSAAMTVTVAAAGLVVVLHATGYFAGAPRRPAALAGLLGFLAAMQGLVLADGFLTLLIFWELVGAASARLIAFSREDVTAPAAAVRAFLTTRTADVGLVLAVVALFTASGSVGFAVPRPDGGLGVVVGLGLVVAAMGKSAQAPLQTWLSAAMAGPAPVSALLHSATMAAAGVFLLVRAETQLAGWPLEVAGWVGAITAVLAAGVALAQSDLKRVLAASTSSQLGLMFVGAAAGGPAVAVFHLVAHAAAKAGLFLAAGLFSGHRDGTDLEGLRGVGRDDRPAFAAFAVCALSIAAVPPLAAFFSKDHIAAAAEEANLVWFALVLVAAAGSAAYVLRPALVLWDPRGAGRPLRREGRRAMLIAVGVAAGASLLLGLAGGPLAGLLGGTELPTTSLSLALSLPAVLAGALVALRRPALPAAVRDAWRAQLGTDALLRAVLQRPLLAAGRALDVAERRGLDAAVDAAARLTRSVSALVDRGERRVLDRAVDASGPATLAVARASDWIERRGVDATVDGVARRVGRGGDDLRRVQSGWLYEYLRDAVVGVGALAAVLTLTALL